MSHFNLHKSFSQRLRLKVCVKRHEIKERGIERDREIRVDRKSLINSQSISWKNGCCAITSLMCCPIITFLHIVNLRNLWYHQLLMLFSSVDECQ
jgi:hypothetical protein